MFFSLMTNTINASTMPSASHAKKIESEKCYLINRYMYILLYPSFKKIEATIQYRKWIIVQSLIG